MSADQWHVPCQDEAGADRTCEVPVDESRRVVVGLVDGEPASFTWRQAQALSAHVTAAGLAVLRGEPL
ncbi:MAG TPA: hypothetical protein VHW44_06815 [Pseudonocardiaceae bacterium]|nr:hypothetical protein [Pseudonocardiaceae bacterium]